jgi:hypothetical protein
MSNQRESRVKTWVLLLAGLAGIGYQQYTGETDWILLLIFSAMTGVPGITEVINLLRNSTTALPSSLPQPQGSEQESDSSSNNSLEDENGQR